MAHKKHSWNKSVLHRSARGPQSPGGKRRLVLHLERLEDRFLMDGDPVLTDPVSLTADVDLASPAVIADISISDFSPIRYPFYELATAPPETSSFNRIEDLPDWLVAEADKRHGDLYGKTLSSLRFHYWHWRSSGLLDSDTAAPILFATSSDAASNFSTTNTQVAGVDEADLVETDGKYLYVISQNELLIFDARESDKLSLESRIKLDARPTGMYLAGDRLTLVTSGRNDGFAPNVRGNRIRGNTNFFLSDDWGGNYHHMPSTTEVKVLDVSDRSMPKLVQSTELDGRLVSSRMVYGELRIVLQQDSRHWSNLLPNPKKYHVSYDEATQTDHYRHETRNEYLGRVYESLENYSLPGYRTLSVDGEVLDKQDLMTWEELAEPVSSRYGSVTTIATFDTLGHTTGPVATKTLFANAVAEIYATEDSLYVFGTSVRSARNQTSIWKYDFDPTDHSIQLSAQGHVDGRLLNQFSADEHDGHLRVVTQGQRWNSAQSLFVLKQVGKNLKTVGEVENLAPGERLHSVRFTGSEAFVVTFRKVDPLFAIDLSDPTNPVVAGELKTPGYSDYLQPIDENHLLGIGRGADESIGLFQELQVSIFDVSDLNDPQLAHRYSFEGGRSTASLATGGRWTQGDGDHHAVSYFPSAEILAIPVHSPDQQGGFRAGVNNTAILGTQESALQVFQVDVQTGFKPIATIKHDSRIVRSLQIGEQLIVVSVDQITVHDLNNPSQTLAEIDLRIGSNEGLVELAANLSPQTLAAIQLLTTTSGEGLADRAVPRLQTTQEFPLGEEALLPMTKTETHYRLASDAFLETLGVTEGTTLADPEIDPVSENFAILNPEFQKALGEILPD